MRFAVTVFVCALVAALGARTAYAIPYETFIDVDDEGDLADLLSSGDISQDTYDELLDLMSRGVDITTADRNELYTLPNLTYEDVDAIIAYRKLQRGLINDPADLVAAGAISQEKLLSIASFIVVRERADKPFAARGWVRVWTRTTPHDYALKNNPANKGPFLIPPVALRARVMAMRNLTFGIAATNTRLDIGDPVYDPNRGALIADARSNQLHVPKAYVKWESSDLSGIVGSYRIGFGQRLVFDNSAHYSPNGLYLDDQIYYSGDLSTICKESAGELLTSPCVGQFDSEYVTPDFQWRDGLFGAAIGAKHIELTTGWLQLYGWASLHKRSVYQYELVDHGVDGTKCPDPHDDDNPDCTAPTVYVTPDGDLLTPTPQHSFATLPNVIGEELFGGNIGYFADRRNSVGLTFYTANENSLINGVDLDFQEWSRIPYGGRFGALGANFSFGTGWLDLFGEAALSFDHINIDPSLNATPAKGGGGPAGLLRMTATRKHEELEVVGRYYSTDYVNPFARPISEADEFEGQRARDEAGLRTRYIRTGKDWTLRALLDVWTNPSDLGALKLDTYARANVRTAQELWLGLWERFQDKDLTEGAPLHGDGSAPLSSHDQCFELSTEDDMNGEPIPCTGRQLTTIARAQYIPNKKMSAIVQLEHQLIDDNSKTELKTKFRQDVAAWFIGYYRPTPGDRIRVRVRYLNEAVTFPDYLETSIAALAEYTTKLREKDTLRVRLDSRFWLDKRTSTSERVPNPEVTLWLFYQASL
ncbi:MAG TPA: hypothetical protein VL326_10825 [Kofleriaceae bacterium]|nr:hypothetical protein [Kofleriaceae bacterium]